MSNVTIFAGLDVSKAYFDACLLAGETQQLRHFSYDPQGLSNLAEWLPAGCHCVMEATGAYHIRLATFLYTHGFVVSVVNPLVIKRFSQMRLLRAKTDRADARLIAAYGCAERPGCWQPPSSFVTRMQQLDALLGQWQKQRSALLCQREAFNASGVMDRQVSRFVCDALLQVEQQIKKLTEAMEALAEQHYGALLGNLTTVPGIGRKTAMLLIVLTGGFTRFDSAKQLSAYVGLSPRTFQSGSSVRAKARICKMGMSRIRALLYMCAWSAKRCNKACHELYERLIAKGKPRRLALIAVANKLLKQAFAVAVHQTTYQENYSKQICL